MYMYSRGVHEMQFVESKIILIVRNVSKIFSLTNKILFIIIYNKRLPYVYIIYYIYIRYIDIFKNAIHNY